MELCYNAKCNNSFGLLPLKNKFFGGNSPPSIIRRKLLMSIFNFNEIRSRWRRIFFKHHGISKIYNNFDSNSLEIILIENLLSNFSKGKKINNKYAILSGVDYNFYEKDVHKSINEVMLLMACQECIDYKIIYRDTTVYIILL